MFLIVSCNIPKKLSCPDYAKNSKLEQHAHFIKNIKKKNESLETTVNRKKLSIYEISYIQKESVKNIFVLKEAKPTFSLYNSHFYNLLEIKFKGEENTKTKIESQSAKNEKVHTKIERKKNRLERSPALKKRKANGFAIASFFLGLSGLISISYLLPVTAILAIIFGIIALTQIKRKGQSGRGLAIAGIILGGLGLFLLWFILHIALGI